MDHSTQNSGAAAARILAEDPAGEKQTLFGISELAKEFGVSTRTIRFYEDKGLITPDRVNGARIFSRRDRARLALILRAKAIGAPLADIKAFLDLYGEAGEGRRDQMSYLVQRPDEELGELERKKALIDDTISELVRMRAEAAVALSKI